MRKPQKGVCVRVCVCVCVGGGGGGGAGVRLEGRGGRLGRGAVNESRSGTWQLQPASCETGRQCVVCCPCRWVAHRSTQRYLRHFKGIFTSRTFRALLKPLSLLTALSVFAASLQSGLAAHAVPLPLYELPFRIGDLPFGLTSFAVSLLLVFRTDRSYSRWEDALETFNGVRNVCKELAIVNALWVGEPDLQACFARWLVAFPAALQASVRQYSSLDEDLSEVLLPDEVEAVRGSDSPPYFVLHVLCQLTDLAALPDIRLARAYGAINQLRVAVGTCEKILRYPIPLSYTRHTSRFMIIWLACLPFALWDSAGWAVIPITSLLSYLLLGIDQIGVQIEEPFGILPLEEICLDIKTEVDATLRKPGIREEIGFQARIRP